jgi:hypothetical protein
MMFSMPIVWFGYVGFLVYFATTGVSEFLGWGTLASLLVAICALRWRLSSLVLVGYGLAVHFGWHCILGILAGYLLSIVVKALWGTMTLRLKKAEDLRRLRRTVGYYY